MSRIRVEQGDCLEVMPRLVAEGLRFDAVVTDPPYHLTSIARRWGATESGREGYAMASPSPHSRVSRGFMGQAWDGGDIAFRPETWRAVYDCMKPGAHLLAFSSSRTYHRVAVAIEDAGFELRDSLLWMFGSGFPKSHDPRVRPTSLPRSMTRADWRDWHRLARVMSGSALKPAFEIIAMARRPGESTLALNLHRHGTGTLNINGCRIPAVDEQDQERQRRCAGFNQSYGDGRPGIALEGSADGSLHRKDRTLFDPTKGRWPPNVAHDGSPEIMEAFKPYGETVSVGGRASKVGMQVLRGTEKPIVAGATPGLGDSGSVARFFPAFPGPGRWPANVTHDGSPEVMEAFDQFGESRTSGRYVRGTDDKSTWLPRKQAGDVHAGFGDFGSAARFFYSSKARREDRLGSRHPTVKPVDLMAWLCRLVTPPDGLVLDPFAGSGTTGAACMREGFRAVLIEKHAAFIKDIRSRLSHAEGADLPLFGGAP